MLRGASDDRTVGKQLMCSMKRKLEKNVRLYQRRGGGGAQIGHKKTHSFERTHVLDSKVTLTHHERNDAGRERREERKSKERREGKEKNTFSEVEKEKKMFS